MVKYCHVNMGSELKVAVVEVVDLSVLPRYVLDLKGLSTFDLHLNFQTFLIPALQESTLGHSRGRGLSGRSYT